MAKWGEGDPRWIVEERADATNVNNWHWTEKNAGPWSREKLKNLLVGLVIEDESVGRCEIKEVSTLDGEATANNRKAKLIFFYEWNIVAEWEGILTGCNVRHKGKIEIPNLSDEHSDARDVDVTITVERTNEDSVKLKNFMHNKGREIVTEKLAEYIKDLKSQFSQGMILPSSSKAEAKVAPPVKVDKKEFMNSTVKSAPSSNKAASGVKIDTKILKDTITFQCQPNHIYNALTQPDMVRAFTHGSVQKFQGEKGGRFELFDSTISGDFILMSPYERVDMHWRLKSWPAAHYSTVSLEITSKESDTQVKITQSGIPADDFERTKAGWDRYYWNSIRQTFGFGAKLF